MSNIIEARDQRARQTWLSQQAASALIDDIEYCEPVRRPLHLMAFHGAAGCLIDAHEVGGGGQPPKAFIDRSLITASSNCTVIFIDAGYPTGGPALVNSLPATEQAKHELRSGVNNWARWAETTRELLQRPEAHAKQLSSAAGTLRVERLAHIQAALGLPMQALADVLRVSRPGLYKWLDASKQITLQEASRQRIAAIERLAKLWRERSTAPLNSIAHEPLARGRTVLELLTGEALDEVDIIDAFDEAAARLQGKPKSLSQRMAEVGFTRRPSHRSISDDE